MFLSIGYSSCHWCHVMAHESFEDEQIAALLNRHFISIKVDKEERPDIDSIYMSFCQEFTGSGGWPTSIFMSADQKPFFAGTYFPKHTRHGILGLYDLLGIIHEKWTTDRDSLLNQAEEITTALKQNTAVSGTADIELAHTAVEIYKRIYDQKYAGFGRAPKFPIPHNLLFLLSYYQRFDNKECLYMAEHTLLQIYRGGIFDHIGFGFCRYSTDKRFLVPHFEKMLYDNALLILAYSKAYSVTKNSLYLEIAEKTADYILREMTSPEGGFYSAQDADSEGEEGKYYLFMRDEITELLGKEDGDAFNRHYGITESGNFESKNIPNLLSCDPTDKGFDIFLPKLYDYRKNRYSLHLDDKVLTCWNSLMIAAMSELYLVSKNNKYLEAAENADLFITNHLCEEDTLYVSFREGQRGVTGFLEDYAAYILCQLSLYRATLKFQYLERATKFCDKVLSDFKDTSGGFYLYSNQSEELILKPKETYDGALPSGNSLMALNLVRLYLLTHEEKYRNEAEQVLDFIASSAMEYPTGHAMFLTALLEYKEPPVKITAVLDSKTSLSDLVKKLPHDAVIIPLTKPTNEYPIKNQKTTYYVCRNHSCLPAVNELNF